MDSIRFRLIGIAVLFIIGTSVALGALSLHLATGFLNVRFQQNFELLAAYFARNVELGVLLKDRNMLARLGQNILDQDDIQEVIIFSETGDVLISMASATQDERPGRVKASILSSQMPADNLPLEALLQKKIIGEVHLVYSTAGLYHLQQVLTHRLIQAAALLALVSAALYWFLARAIVAPLNDLLTVARQVSEGRLDVRAGGGRFREIRTLAQTFNAMLNNLKLSHEQLEIAHSEMGHRKTLAEIGRFSMMVAHEIKNPLAIIKGSLDILVKQQTDEPTRRNMIDFMNEEINRINRLVEDFLLYAKPVRYAFSRLNMDTFMQRLIQKCDFLAANRIVFETLAPVDIPVSADAHHLERAIFNVIRNAHDMSQPDSPVTIQISTEETSWICRISDAGPGIADAHLARIFDPFFTTRAQGSGLGLAMTRDIIEAHGGEISAGNLARGGACFTIRLPRLEVDGFRENFEL